MANKAWKTHEREVAGFFGTERSKQNLTHDYRLTGTSPSDVIVEVKDWLEPKKRYRPPEPYKTIVVECKHSGDISSWRSTWTPWRSMRASTGAKGRSSVS